MKVEIYSYRFAEEILQHPRHAEAWAEIQSVLTSAPLFVFPGKSKKNKGLDVVQQVMNTYFDRRFAVDLKWDAQPLATRIVASGLSADFRKSFGDVVVQMEIQFGNMSRWYSDIFKFQTAYSQSLINLGFCVLPTRSLAKRIDSNVAQYERAKRELPSAELSITLPLVLAGLEPDKKTKIVDISKSKFKSIRKINGKGNSENRWRLVNAYLSKTPMSLVGPKSPTGPMIDASSADLDEAAES